MGPDICRQHCAIDYVNGAIVIMPLDRAAAVCVDNSRIYSATALNHGASVLLGRDHLFQFIDPVALQVRCAWFLYKISSSSSSSSSNSIVNNNNDNNIFVN